MSPALRFLNRTRYFIKFSILLQASEILYTNICALTKSLERIFKSVSNRLNPAPDLWTKWYASPGIWQLVCDENFTPRSCQGFHNWELDDWKICFTQRTMTKSCFNVSARVFQCVSRTCSLKRFCFQSSPWRVVCIVLWSCLWHGNPLCTIEIVASW